MKRFLCIVGLMAFALFANAFDAIKTLPNDMKPAAMSVFKPAPLARVQEPGGTFNYSLSTIYTFKSKQISEVVLIPAYNLIKDVPKIGGSLDCDGFAGLSTNGAAVGGAALVYSKRLNEHIAGQLGLAATMKNRTPTDFGILVAIGIKF